MLADSAGTTKMPSDLTYSRTRHPHARGKGAILTVRRLSMAELLGVETLYAVPFDWF
jgi:hypothetical protein